MEDLSMRIHYLVTGIIAILVASTSPTCVRGQRESTPTEQHAGARRTGHYRLFDLGTLGGPRSSFPFSAAIINDRGEATGFSDTAATTRNDTGFACLDLFVIHAFFWHDGHMDLLPGLSEDGCSLPVQINDRSEVIGISQNGVADPLTGFIEDRAVVWRDGQVHDLGTLGGNESLATAINRRGQIVGWSENEILDPVSLMGETQTRAFLWEDGRMLDLGTLGGPDAYAIHINDEGQVVGGSYLDATVHPITGLPTVVPFLWSKGRMKSLGHLGGTFSEALQINNDGQVLGDGTVAGDLETHPTFWENDRLIDLNTSSVGGSLLTANWLNEEGEVVGAADFTSVGGPAFGGAMWRKGVLINIDREDSACGVEAWGKNDRGQAIGSAHCLGESHAWLWSHGHAIDLNTFVPSNAPLRLVYGIMINNRGDIAGIGVPPGVSDADALASGHAFILAVVDDGDTTDDDSDSTTAAIYRPVAGSARSQGFDPPTRETMMKLHELVAAQIHPFSMRRRGLHQPARLSPQPH
jgi:probable HAF family extracellular repeat protein